MESLLPITLRKTCYWFNSISFQKHVYHGFKSICYRISNIFIGLVVYFYELIVYMLLERNVFDSIAFFSQCRPLLPIEVSASRNCKWLRWCNNVFSFIVYRRERHSSRFTPINNYRYFDRITVFPSSTYSCERSLNYRMKYFYTCMYSLHKMINFSLVRENNFYNCCASALWPKHHIPYNFSRNPIVNFKNSGNFVWKN